jgi:hypothetical protein
MLTVRRSEVLYHLGYGIKKACCRVLYSCRTKYRVMVDDWMADFWKGGVSGSSATVGKQPRTTAGIRLASCTLSEEEACSASAGRIVPEAPDRGCGRLLINSTGRCRDCNYLS